MKEKLIELIKNSSMLKDGDKEMYLAMLDSLSDERMADLMVILEKEATIKDDIDAETEKKVSDANKEYLKEMDETYDKEKKEAVKAAEKDDHKKADEMISNI